MHCAVCGKDDDQKPICFRGERYCSELHRKILNGEYGYDVGRLLEMGLITHEQAAGAWGMDFELGKRGEVVE